jgi:peptidoglycan/xylan/chitin deacetylase (PgdA/CDA1 family)
VTAAIAGVLERGPYGSAQARAARAALSADEAPEGKAPTFGFAANGDLVVTFAPRVLWSRAEPVSVTLAGGALGPRLSGAGLAARGAAQANRVRAVAPAPPNCAREKCVALTFDDGPGSFTAELVELLQRRKVPATFFLVGNRVQLGPDLAQLLDSAGMEVGNHSSSHKELPNLATPELGRDLRQASEVLAAVTGRRPTLLRPPYGSRNVAVDRASKELGMSVILWDVDTLDWRYPDAARARSAAVNPARRGSIILLHDVHRTSVAAVPGIIEDLQRRGFTLVTVSQLIGGQTEPGQVYRQQPAPR